MRTRNDRQRCSRNALSAARVLIFSLACLTAASAHALSDGGFESGFGAWNVFGDVMLEDTTVIDVRDGNYTSAALLDNFAIVSEPLTGVSIFLGLLGLAAAGTPTVSRPKR